MKWYKKSYNENGIYDYLVLKSKVMLLYHIIIFDIATRDWLVL